MQPKTSNDIREVAVGFRPMALIVVTFYRPEVAKGIRAQPWESTAADPRLAGWEGGSLKMFDAQARAPKACQEASMSRRPKKP